MILLYKPTFQLYKNMAKFYASTFFRVFCLNTFRFRTQVSLIALTSREIGPRVKSRCRIMFIVLKQFWLDLLFWWSSITKMCKRRAIWNWLGLQYSKSHKNLWLLFEFDKLFNPIQKEKALNFNNPKFFKANPTNK